MTTATLVFSFVEKYLGESRRNNGCFDIADKLTASNEVVKTFTVILYSADVHCCFNRNQELSSVGS